MCGLITVRWTSDGEGGPLGWPLSDPMGRYGKRVRVAPDFTGPPPGVGTETEARIVCDSPPWDVYDGVLTVYPLYAPAPGDLSEVDAMEQLLRTARAAGPVLGLNLVPIEVALQGWHGRLEGRRLRIPDRSGPLSAVWFFYHGSNGDVRLICDPKSPMGGVPLTEGIRLYRDGFMEVTDWGQAVADLGMPTCTPESGESVQVVWRDVRGGELVIRGVPASQIPHLH